MGLDRQFDCNLLEWAEASLASGSNVLAKSNQGTVLLFEGEGLKLVIKTAMGRGAVRKARRVHRRNLRELLDDGPLPTVPRV